VGFHTFKDQVVLEKNEVVRDDGQPYTVFTPYSKKWKKVIAAERLAPRPSEKHPDRFVKRAFQAVPTLASIGFHDTGVRVPPPELDPVIARDYHTYRDFPARQGTTGLSVHLRFGTISIRDLACRVSALNETLLNELIWREFYMMILWHFPCVAARAFRPAYDHIVWRNNEEEFAAWMEGRTGYPIVDAGMRQLNETGYMHNRVRMIVASFLVKHLLIDWRWGEQYFASRLMDFDQSANNGGWQWAAGSGCDAAPYFRIFNPALQTAKFDPDLRYIRQWVPELDQFSYPQPVVNHEMARKRCIDTYKKYLNAGF
jgi:deoxyribodipyrimidine photo-lyase